MFNKIAPVICFLMCIINIPFIIHNPSGAYFNWMSAVFCFGMGIVCTINNRI